MNPGRCLGDIDVRFLSMRPGEELARQVETGAGRFRKEVEGGFRQMGRLNSAPRVSRDSDRSSYDRQDGASMFDGGEIPQEPHRFVPPRTLRKIVPSASSASGGDSVSGNPFGVSEGRQIEHERFGRGVIEKIEGVGDNCKATVRFENAGVKQLLLKFARFKVK